MLLRRVVEKGQLRQFVAEFEQVRQFESQSWHEPGVPNCPSGQFAQMLRSEEEHDEHPFKQAVQLFNP